MPTLEVVKDFPPVGKIDPVGICSSSPKRRIRTATPQRGVPVNSNISKIPITKKVEPAGRMATEEELEIFRQGREEIARGEYYAKRPDETVEEFFDRIEADPEGTMACNQPGWKL